MLSIFFKLWIAFELVKIIELKFLKSISDINIGFILNIEKLVT